MPKPNFSLSLDNLRNGLAPLYHRHPNRSHPQGAYVELSPGGQVSAGWSDEALHPCAPQPLRWPVAPAVAGQVLADYLEGEEAQALLGKVQAGQLASAELGQALQGMDLADVQRVAEWLGSVPWCEVWPVADNLDQAVEGLRQMARADHTTLDGDLRDYLLGQAQIRHHSDPALVSALQVEELRTSGRIF